MRHQKKRWFAALLSLCMLLSILPSTSLAFSESEETWSGNRRNQTIDGGTHTITLSNLTIDSPGVEKSAIDITGNADVTFILEGNNTLRGYRNHPAIWVESGSSVTFEGNGLLEASAGGASIGLGAAGIGGGYGASSNFGNITINGGRFLTSGGMGTMGYSVPAAIGAKLADPSRQVVAVCGDGSFQMQMMELATAVQHDVAVKIVVMRNNYLGMVRELQEKAYDNRLMAVSIDGSPCFTKLADAYGIENELVDSTDKMDSAIQRMMNSDKPFLLEVAVEDFEKTIL